MMTRNGGRNRDQIEFTSLEELVPEDHLVRKLENAIDWSFIYELVEDSYKYRKETIERIFGLAKELHGFRYTQQYGKAQMEVKAALTYACLNLKKLAKKRWKTRLFLHFFIFFWTYISIFPTFVQKTRFRPEPKAGLSTV